MRKSKLIRAFKQFTIKQHLEMLFSSILVVCSLLLMLVLAHLVHIAPKLISDHEYIVQKLEESEQMEVNDWYE
ncbi:hypothetical protein JXA27_06560 [Aerococcaceae bacterium zg-B36]|uniref:hypothetical protein n=1 Tax=Aerococcaceae bacterium zg-252 TaxID=2796928 RepID=UPI001BD8EC94|nr:hypothetical protein [Aerococcaceae bacterium zg-B36]